jgi:four helix bundle suffix protein
MREFNTTYSTDTTHLSNPAPAANAMITLINQTNYLVDQQIKAVEQQFAAKGINRETHLQKIASNERAEKERGKI